MLLRLLRPICSSRLPVNTVRGDTAARCTSRCLSNKSRQSEHRANAKQELSVNSTLSELSSIYKRDGRQRWMKSPYKAKQLRYSRHIMNLVSKGKVPEAVEVFESMWRNRVRPEAAVYNTLIAGYGKQGNVKESFRIFNKMKKHGLTPTDHTYTSMLSACAEAGPKAEPILEKVKNEIERRNVRLNSIGTNAHISALASCRQHEDALRAYLDMLKVGVTPDLHTYSGLLLASAKDTDDGMSVAQRVWQEVAASGCKPDMYCFNLLLQCLRDAGLQGTPTTIKSSLTQVPPIELSSDDKDTQLDSDQADRHPRSGSKENLHSIKVRQVESFDFLLTRNQRLTVILGYVALQSPTDSKDPPMRWLDDTSVQLLFETLVTAQLKPDIRLFHLLLQLVLSPCEVFRYMESCGVIPDERAMLSAVRTQTHLGNLRGAKALLGYSRSLGVKVGQSGYQALATCCNREREGLELLEEMKAAGLTPNEFVFGTLIGNALRSKSYEYVTSLLKRMRYFEVLPNDTIMEMLETAASSKPKTPSHVRRHNGFKGYYTIWKSLMVSQS